MKKINCLHFFILDAIKSNSVQENLLSNFNFLYFILLDKNPHQIWQKDRAKLWFLTVLNGVNDENWKVDFNISGNYFMELVE